MTERARPLTIKFYPDLTQSWFWVGQPLRDTEPVKSHSSQNFGETACFLPKFFSQMAIVKQLVKDLYCSQERSVREEQTE